MEVELFFKGKSMGKLQGLNTETPKIEKKYEVEITTKEGEVFTVHTNKLIMDEESGMAEIDNATFSGVVINNESWATGIKGN